MWDVNSVHLFSSLVNLLPACSCLDIEKRKMSVKKISCGDLQHEPHNLIYKWFGRAFDVQASQKCNSISLSGFTQTTIWKKAPTN